jgi:hypothetical protein
MGKLGASAADLFCFITALIQVAEMTGRRGRIVRDRHSSGRFVYELRAKPDSNDMDSLNGEL